jgi:hypothetical protein
MTLRDRNTIIDEVYSSHARRLPNVPWDKLVSLTSDTLARDHGLVVTPGEILQALAETAGFVE